MLSRSSNISKSLYKIHALPSGIKSVVPIYHPNSSQDELAEGIVEKMEEKQKQREVLTV